MIEDEYQHKMQQMLDDAILEDKIKTRVIRSFYVITEKVYGESIASIVTKTCFNYTKTFCITSDQWKRIFNQFNSFITKDLFNKREGKPILQTQETVMNELERIHLQEVQANLSWFKRQEEEKIKKETEAIRASRIELEKEIELLKAEVANMKAMQQPTSASTLDSSTRFFPSASSLSREVGQKSFYIEEESEHQRYPSGEPHNIGGKVRKLSE